MQAESEAKQNLNNFIARERGICDSTFPAIEWNSDTWPVKNIDPSFRGKEFNLPFSTHNQPIINRGLEQPARNIPLPSPYKAFCKALVIYIRRTSNVKARALNAYLNEARRLYNVMYFRDEKSPVSLMNYHFSYLHNYLSDIGYVQLYDATTNLSRISTIIDSHGISTTGTAYKTAEKPKRQHLKVRHIDDVLSDKEFSREAVEAYAKATNNPINDGEEIILRTLDLLFAMGQRANEVTHIPLKCWVERKEKDAQGRILRHPKTGKPIKTYGIRYYAEKKAKDRVHWLADQDVSFARRAVNRLTELTQEARSVAKFQRENPSRIWMVDPDREMSYLDLFRYFSFASRDGLRKFLNKLGVNPCRGNGNLPYFKSVEIEKALMEHERLGCVIRNHVALSDVGGKPVLFKDELLSIAFDGAFRMKRRAHLIKVVVTKISIVQLNNALGSNPKQESIFERRGLTEADGSKIVLTTHMPRHWRNTLYEIAGMSEVQQALALGRADISQNPHYQHASVEEKNSALHELINTRNPTRRVELFKQGVREGFVYGNVSDAYKKLKFRSPIEAEEFLDTHVMASHVTPYGVCAHDFSKAPCPKHLQCFDSCSHLHRTDNLDENRHLDDLIERQEKNIERMRQCGCGDAGSDIWLKVEERKLAGMKIAREIETSAINQKVFFHGAKKDTSRRRSAVRED